MTCPCSKQCTITVAIGQRQRYRMQSTVLDTLGWSQAAAGCYTGCRHRRVLHRMPSPTLPRHSSVVRTHGQPCCRNTQAGVHRQEHERQKGHCSSEHQWVHYSIEQLHKCKSTQVHNDECTLVGTPLSVMPLPPEVCPALRLMPPTVRRHRADWLARGGRGVGSRWGLAVSEQRGEQNEGSVCCLLYTSPSPRD